MKVSDIIKQLEQYPTDSELLVISYEPSIIAEICDIPLAEIPNYIKFLEDNLDTEGLQLDMQNLATLYKKELIL